jgi:hypothetical protein
MLKRETIDWSARAGRRDVHITGAAAWPDGTSASVMVSNLSYEGCELRSAHGFTKGETVRLSLPNTGKIQAQIRWVKGGCAGARFLTGDSVPDQRRARLGI